MTSNENIVRIGKILTRNEQPITGLQGPMGTSVLQNLVTLVNTQPQGTPFKDAYRPVTTNVVQQPLSGVGITPSTTIDSISATKCGD